MKTVFEKTEWFRKAEYGFFFHFLNSGSALHPQENRSQRIPAPPDEWNRMVERAMEKDFSWKNSTKLYLELYNQLIGKP